MNQKPLAITIVEDNPYTREGWEAVLRTVQGIDVLGAYPGCEAALANHGFQGANVVLLDIGLPGMSGIEGLAHIRKAAPDAAVVMCTVFDDDENIFRAICAGAVGYLLKKTSPEELIRAVRDAAAGGSPMTPNIARKVISTFQRQAAQTAGVLNEREQSILALMAQGKSYAGIGDDLFLSIDGVRYHVRNIYEKLQVHSRSEAVARGYRDRLITGSGR